MSGLGSFLASKDNKQHPSILSNTVYIEIPDKQITLYIVPGLPQGSRHTLGPPNRTEDT